MNWTGLFILSAAVLVVSIAAAIVSFRNAVKFKRGRIGILFNILFGGVFFSVLICMLPVRYSQLPKDLYAPLKAVMLSLHSTFQIFTINVDLKAILEECTKNLDPWLVDLYPAYLSVLSVIAPILTFGFLASFIRNLSAYLRCIFRLFSDIYIFSELNEKSLALGRDIKRKHKRAGIIFTSVYEDQGESSRELIERAKELNAICFKKDILTINFRLLSGRRPITFFAVKENEAKNVEQALELIDAYKDRDNTDLIVFSTRVEAEFLLPWKEAGKLRVRRVDTVRTQINQILYEEGYKLFERARPISPTTKKISAVIVGMGRHGTEMLKALTWFCQMDGYEVRLDAFDQDKHAGDRFAALAPDLMSKKYNGVKLPGEAEYEIHIHSKYDVTTKKFADELMKLKETTYVLVSLGSDEMNIRTSVELRMLFERMDIHPTIQTIVYNTKVKRELAGLQNFRGQPYDIDFIGDLESIFSADMIIDNRLEMEALRRHMEWGPADTFASEYNYRSSVAAAIHMRARIFCKIPSVGKELTPEERAALEALEHRHWNAYMRAEGYIYSGSTAAGTRNDLGKMHHDLVPVVSLSEEERRKDSKIGTV